MLNKEKLEELLIGNWTKFVDVKKLMTFTLQCGNEITNRTKYCGDLKRVSKITITKFTPTINGFNVWVDFTNPSSEGTLIIGTVELFISLNGEIYHIRTVGNILF